MKGEEEGEDNLYALLNLPKNATEEEIRQSFRKLSVLYHPDKHRDEKVKQASQDIFQKLHQAYSILISPDSRKIYDEFGMEGIHANWQVTAYQGGGLTERIVEEMRREEEKRLQSFRTKASISTSLDATALFDDQSYYDLGILDYLPLVKRLGMRQSFQAWIGPKTEATLGYALETGNGLGSGNASLNLEHRFNGEVTANGGFLWGEQRFGYASVAKTLSKSTMVSSRISGQVLDGQLYPSLQGTLVRVIPYNIVTSMTVGIGYPRSLILTTSKTFDSWETSISLQFASQAPPLLSLVTAYRIDRAHRVEFKLTGSAEDAKARIALRKQWSPLYESVAGLHVSETEGVILKLSLIRDRDYKLSVPLHLSEAMSASSILVGAALPVILGFLTDRLIVRPYQRYIEEVEGRGKRAEINARVAADRTEAEMAILVLQEAYERKRASEELSNGLVILEAFYETEKDSWDVKVPLQVLVYDGKLVLPPSSKVHLVGFYNLDPGARKRLRVSYSFRGKAHRVTVLDHEALLLPQRDHLII